MKTRIFAGSRLLGNFVVLLLGITTLMFFALRAAGDPIIVMAGENAGPEMVEALRQQYGFDQPLLLQYLYYLGNVLRLDFGASLASGEAALPLVLSQLPATLLLAFLGMTVTIAVAVPVGAWLGSRPDRTSARIVSVIVVFAQGLPGSIDIIDQQLGKQTDD